MILMLFACGKDKKSFKVEYVGVPKMVQKDIIVHGEIDGENMDIPLKEAFKGYIINDLSMENVADKVAEDGYVYYAGGAIVTLEDDSGKTLDISMSEGSIFEIETEDDTIYLLPPK